MDLIDLGVVVIVLIFAIFVLLPELVGMMG